MCAPDFRPKATISATSALPVTIAFSEQGETGVSGRKRFGHDPGADQSNTRCALQLL